MNTVFTDVPAQDAHNPIPIHSINTYSTITFASFNARSFTNIAK